MAGEPTEATRELKAMLMAQSGMTREGYMDGKDPFIRRTEADAITWSKGRF